MKYFLFFILFYAASYGQTNQNTLLPNVMPTNPQAYQFMKPTEMPVASYTGMPDISVPIYTIKAKGLDIPISLNYIANGIKVNEEAGWVGLGWSLSTDMEIVQVIAGMDDFGHYKHRLFPNLTCLISQMAGGLSANTVMQGCMPFFLNHDDNWNTNHPGCEIHPSYTAGVWDSEPDIFYFNAAGYSGKFVLDWAQNKFVCLTDKNVIVEANTDFANDFIIKVPDGHMFSFGLKESTIINRSYAIRSNGGGVPRNVELAGQNSSRIYKLKSILTNKQDLITFNYKNQYGNSPIPISKNFPNINITRRTYSPNMGSDYVPENAGFTTSFLATQQTYSYLSSIVCSNGLEVQFSSSPRQDIKEARKLDKIDVSFMGSHKVFNLSYDYFVGHTDGSNWDSFLNYLGYNSDKTPQELTHRLKLLSVGKMYEKPYLFEYNTQQLPKKTSYATDYWGFYNGYHNNNSFFPDIYRFNIERDNIVYMENRGNNNSADLTYCKAAILEKVTYPTGGYTFYNYGLNKFDNYIVPPASQGVHKTVQISTLVSAQAGYGNDIAILVEGGSTLFTGSAFLSIRGCTNPESYSNCYVKKIHFKKELIPLVKAFPNYNTYGLEYVLNTMGLLDDMPGGAYDQYIDDDTFPVRVWANTAVEQSFNNELYNVPEGIVYFRVNGGCGAYNYTYNTPPHLINTSQATLNLTYWDYKPLVAANSEGAGLRIESVSTFSDENVLALRKSYEYEGGKLMSPLIYFNKSIESHSHQEVLAYHSATLECAFANSELHILNSNIRNARQRFMENKTSANASLLNDLEYRFANNPNLSCIDSPITRTVNFYGYKNELHSGSFIQPSTGASGKYVGYDRTIEKNISNEYVSGPSVPSNGRIVRQYINNPDMGAPSNNLGLGSFTEIGIPLTKKYPENGLVQQEDIYEGAALKRQVTNGYEFIKENCKWAMKTLATGTYEYLIPLTPFTQQRSRYLDGFYPLTSGTTVLKASKTRYIEDGHDVSVLTNYNYDSHNQRSYTSALDSKGELIEIQNYYPYDIQNEYFGMVSRNFISPVVKSRKSIGGIPVSVEKTKYRFSGVLNCYTVENLQVAKGGDENDLRETLIYHAYDSNVNPMLVSKKDGAMVLYIWGYHGMYPIVKIENAIYNEYANLITPLVNSSNNDNEEDFLRALATFRTALAASKSMITTYSHIPLVGVSTITDPKGYTSHYKYDTLGRLQSVSDNDLNILEEYKYNFRP